MQPSGKRSIALGAATSRISRRRLAVRLNDALLDLRIAECASGSRYNTGVSSGMPSIALHLRRVREFSGDDCRRATWGLRD
jgi:hypothetical protein